MKKILVVFGTRPEAIKLAPVICALERNPDVAVVPCVTAQHRQMLDQVLSFFQMRPAYDLNIMLVDQPLHDLTAQVLVRLSEVMERERPELVLVQGDTTTAMASALAAYYLHLPVGHVEAGLRTGDRYNPFPEEMNRLIVDHLSDLCFAPTERAKKSLLREGIDPRRVHVTGNTGVDALLEAVQRLPGDDSQARSDGLFDGLPPLLLGPHGGASPDRRRLVLVTGHRRESFGKDLENMCRALLELVQKNPDIEIVYPVHLNPSVREPVHRLLGGLQRIHLLEPLGYGAFVWLMSRSYLVLTDSGGIQEEAPSLGKPILVMRKTTERPEGIEAGTALLVGVETDAIVTAAQRLLDDEQLYRRMAEAHNPYGDGHAADRVAEITLRWLGERAS